MIEDQLPFDDPPRVPEWRRRRHVDPPVRIEIPGIGWITSRNWSRFDSDIRTIVPDPDVL